MYADANSGGWQHFSDRNLKENITPVVPREILERLVQMPISRWNMKGTDVEVPHIGPMAQDFHAAFGLGSDDRHIGSVDADGVALAAIQGLNQKVEARTADLEKELSVKEAEIQTLKASVAELQAAVRRLAHPAN